MHVTKQDVLMLMTLWYVFQSIFYTLFSVDIMKNAGHLLHVQPKKDQIMELSVLKLMEI